MLLSGKGCSDASDDDRRKGFVAVLGEQLGQGDLTSAEGVSHEFAVWPVRPALDAVLVGKAASKVRWSPGFGPRRGTQRRLEGGIATRPVVERAGGGSSVAVGANMLGAKNADTDHYYVGLLLRARTGTPKA